ARARAVLAPYGTARPRRTSTGRPLRPTRGRGTQPLPRLHNELDSRSFLPIDDDVGKGRDTDEVDPARRHKPAGNGNRLDRLVEGPRSNRLQFGAAFLPEYAGEGSGHRVRIRLGRYLEDIHGANTSSGIAAVNIAAGHCLAL